MVAVVVAAATGPVVLLEVAHDVGVAVPMVCAAGFSERMALVRLIRAELAR